jgi:hypothetical protein
MAYVCTWECVTGFKMDIYDTNRVPKSNNIGYYITPQGTMEIEIWKAENNIKDKIKDQEHIDFFISKGWIRKY